MSNEVNGSSADESSAATETNRQANDFVAQKDQSRSGLAGEFLEYTHVLLEQVGLLERHVTWDVGPALDEFLQSSEVE